MSAESASQTAEVTDSRPGRRSYDNTLRQEKAAETRRRIVEAGSGLLHASHVRDWGALTIRAVAERAGVNERTVYRHFVNERGLRDAVLRQLEEEAGIDLEDMSLEDVATIASRIFRHVASFPLEPRPPLDPTLSRANRRQHTALLEAVEHEAVGWSEQDRTMAAAVLDLLWSVGAYERLVREWQLDAPQAIQAICWVIAMVQTAVRTGDGAPTGDE
ncbi:MAG TPA: helix-turn-helix domain-containing protein [Acidimicrobiales bacterium]|nr:helix-turn-helix domain-containing protein [Acidimicrobiales bacterium]